MEDIRDKIDIGKLKEYLKGYPGSGDLRANSKNIVIYPKKGELYHLRNYIREYNLSQYGLQLVFGEHPIKGSCIVIKPKAPGKPIDPKNYSFENREDLEKKLQKPEMPKDIFDAVNSKKLRNYMPGTDFDIVMSGARAKKVLREMFPENVEDINNFTAKQAKSFYHNIRMKYG